MTDGPIGTQADVIDAEARCITVNAGAGTGKTTTMLMRIEHLLASGTDPSDILVLTFANEAAGSIRADIADRLDPATAASIDVYTYHSLCYHLVRDHAYYLGHSPQLEVVTDTQRRRIIERLLASGEYDFALEASSDADIVDDVDEFVARLSRDNVDPATLTARLPDSETIAVLSELTLILKRRATELFSFDREAFRFFNRQSHLEEADQALVAFGQFVTYCREQLAEGPVSTADPVVADVDRYLEGLLDSVTAAREALDLETPLSKHLPRVLFANQIRGETTETVEQTPMGRLQHYVDYLRLARHYVAVYTDYRETIAAEGAVDFDELVREATTLLADETVADSIRSEWDWVCCDEFQDTDTTQFELLTALAGPDVGPNLLAIGDTDQAIYGWRGTDPAGLRKLGGQFQDHASYSLEHNFRSAQPILDVANETSYGPQGSKRLHEAPVEFDRPDGPRVLTVETDRLEPSTPVLVARSIQNLLTGSMAGVQPRDLGDIAVIVRTNRQAAQISAALREARLPHTVTGSPSVDLSPGIQTVISLFRTLVDPSAEAHLRRVLLVRYRLHEADLERLHEAERSLWSALQTIDPATCADPGSVERARSDLTHLRSIREGLPVSRFVETVIDRTSIDWYLEADERETLDRIRQFVEARQGEAVLTPLDESLVDALERRLTGGRSDIDRGSRSADRIDVMTVHQAKGLEFDTVLVPFLSDRDWCVDRDHPERSRHELLSATLDPAIASPLCADLATESVREEWRVFHVAITRAANHLLLFGEAYDYDPPEALGVSLVEDCLPDVVEWGAAGTRMDLWSTLGDGLERVAERHPGAVVGCTDALADPAADRGTPIRNPDGSPVSIGEAIQSVHRLGALLRDDQLLPAADAASVGHGSLDLPADRHLESLTRETSRFPVDAITADDGVGATVHHSHSALTTHERCPRRHYLDHVVFATADPTGDGTADSRVVGSLFHDVAEEAFYRGFTEPGEWHAVAQRHLTARDLEAHGERVHACVDRYFSAEAPSVDEPVHTWESLAAELEFTLETVDDVDGRVVGYVDSIRRLPDGRCAILDYKATANRIAAAEAGQLTLYAEACQRRYGLTADLVGYVYVGTAGPGVELFDLSSVPAWDPIRERLATLETPGFDDYESGPHCADCPHTSLGCAPAAVMEDRWGFGESD